MSVLDPALAWDVRFIYLFIRKEFSSHDTRHGTGAHYVIDATRAGRRRHVLSFFLALRAGPGAKNDINDVGENKGFSLRIHKNKS